MMDVEQAAMQTSKPWYELDQPQDCALVSIKFDVTSNLSIHLIENQSSSGALLGNVIWPGGTVLSTYIALLTTQPHTLSPDHKLDIDPSFLHGKHVIELGSGVGILGIAACRLGPASVTMTDIADCMPLLCRNIQANFSHFDTTTQSCTHTNLHTQTHTSVHAKTLEWSTHHTHPSTLPLHIQQSMPYNVILMSDVVYDGYECDVYGINNHDRLYHTINALADEQTVILLQYTERRPEEKRFFELLSQNFVWCTVRAVDCLPSQYLNTHVDERLSFYSIKKTSMAQSSVVKSMQGRVTTQLLSYLSSQQFNHNVQMHDKLSDRLCDDLSRVSCSEVAVQQCEMCDKRSKHCYTCADCGNQVLCRQCDRQYHMPAKYNHHVRRRGG